ncbi:hypothetical protein BXZ70DRAFT_1053889, partial [Cristinia sonorae]
AHPLQRHLPPCTRHHRPQKPSLPCPISHLSLPQAQRGVSGRCPYTLRHRLPLRQPYLYPCRRSQLVPRPRVRRAHARFQARHPRGSWDVSRDQILRTPTVCACVDQDPGRPGPYGGDLGGWYGHRPAGTLAGWYTSGSATLPVLSTRAGSRRTSASFVIRLLGLADACHCLGFLVGAPSSVSSRCVIKTLAYLMGIWDDGAHPLGSGGLLWHLS